MSENISDRKKIILNSVVEDYIENACPITSGGVKEKHLQEISSATLRSELNALEAMGYLKQLHTSGGRVPTTQGYEYYVKNLLKDIEIDYEKLDGVRELLSERTKSLSEIVSEIAKIISKAVNYPTVVMMSGYDKLVVTDVKVIPLLNNSALALIQTGNGYISNTINVPATQESCTDASNYLSKKFAGKTIGQMVEEIDFLEKNMLDEIKSFKTIVDNLINGMKKAFESKMLDVRHEGSDELLSQAPETAEQTKKAIKLLNNKEDLEKKMQIQTELTFEVLKDDAYSGCAVVKAPIYINGNPVATVGVVGPQRMNYTCIASALKVVMNELNKEKK